ncbi:hypothetical protein BV898_19866 [Hypsibius exemplaris]|uniref:Uncharacterized protein n=1 Tax=Hypsibius exemplaris TaxID=2072580 RepID=A0A9X6NSW0_HYPEX|nr:hypothetical protein BV898_19866 [Hypsibius exemplaris]
MAVALSFSTGYHGVLNMMKNHGSTRGPIPSADRTTHRTGRTSTSFAPSDDRGSARERFRTCTSHVRPPGTRAVELRLEQHRQLK